MSKASSAVVPSTAHRQIEGEEVQQSKLDAAYEKAQSQPGAVANENHSKYLIFRPYIDPITIRPYKP